MQVQQDPPPNIMDMASRKCEEMRCEGLGVETIRDQTGELSGAATNIRTLREAKTSQQARMSRVEEVITTHSRWSGGEHKKTQDLMDIMKRMMREQAERSPHRLWSWMTLS